MEDRKLQTTEQLNYAYGLQTPDIVFHFPFVFHQG